MDINFLIVSYIQIHNLFAFFLIKVSVKMKQYKDELLASCLTFVLSLPHDIIELDLRAYVPALQVGAFSFITALFTRRLGNIKIKSGGYLAASV